MKIGDLIVFMPAGLIATVSKMIRNNISKETSQYISENHLYHCVQSEDIAQKIIESNVLKPSTGIFKNINSYGKAASCMFAGIPTMDSFVKNISKNPYNNPEMICNAVEININEDEINKNYKIRSFSDESILYEGWCVLPPDRANIVQLVADLIRDNNGNPILDEQTKEPIRDRIEKEN